MRGLRSRLAVLTTVFVLVVLLTLAIGFGAADGPADVTVGDLDGDGDSANPYEITNASELQAMEDDLDGHYILTTDIDASETEGWYGGEGFDPIGGETTAFTGSFDGQSYTIDGLVIDRDTDHVGLFGVIDDSGSVENLRIESAAITGNARVGVLAGWMGNTGSEDIINVHVDGTLTASGDAGGLVGSNWADATVSKSSANVMVTGDAGSVGGLVGWSDEATISDSYATGDVDGGTRVGGLVGHIGDGTVTRSYAVGSVRNGDEQGGLAGTLNDGGALTDSYWDEQTTGESAAIGTNLGGTTNGLVALDTDEMQGERALDTMVSLGFYDAWVGTEGYPELLSLAGVEGDGTTNPYTVADVYQLQSMMHNLDADYKLVSNIDASDTETWNSGEGFDPIGDRNSLDGDFDGTPFTGSFDGQDYAITDLYIDRPNQNYVGLFAGAAYTGGDRMVIENVRLKDVDITGKAGTSPHGPDAGGVGGLLGGIDTDEVAADARVENVSVDGDITAAGGQYNVGGVVATTAVLEGDNGDGAVLDNQNVFVGSISAPDVDQVGGIIGRTSHAGTTVGTGYVQADVTGNDAVGGIVGHTSNLESTFEGLYFAGTVSGTSNVGGIAGTVGNDGADFPRTYWDEEIGPDAGWGSAGGTVATEPVGLETDQMQGEAAAENMDELDFTNTWTTATFPVDYPRFQWEPQAFAVQNEHVSNPADQDIQVQFDTSQEIAAVDIEISGAEDGSLDRDDFEQIDEGGDGNYTYRGTYEGSSDGTYDVTFDRIANDQFVDGADGETRSVTVKTQPPAIHDFRINESEGDDVAVTIEAEGRLYGIGVDIDGPETNATLSRIDFTETEDEGSYTYTGSYTTEAAGTYEATVTEATDERGNDAAADQTDTVDIDDPPESEGGVRTAERLGSVFLGGDYFELGIRPDGGFGADMAAPSEFFGSDRSAPPGGRIGMYADVVGFYNDTYDYRYEYFLPGSPEERWTVGYVDGEEEITASAGQNVWSSPIDTTLTEDSDTNTARAIADSQWDDLTVTQTYEFQPSDRHYRTSVTIENIGSSTMEGVRYQRSFDPDNARDLGCSFATNNTVHHQYDRDGRSLVSASVIDGQSCGVTDVSDIPIFYYTTDADARVTHGSWGLVPSDAPFGESQWDDAPVPGASHDRDTYIAVTYNASSLAPGETVNYTYYTALTEDLETTLLEVERDAGSGTDVAPPTADAGEDQDVTVDSTVRFDASGSTADLSIVSYEWEFDDGTNATGVEPIHRFTDVGEYNVTLTVTDAAGKTETDNLTVSVSESPGIELSGTAPTFRDTKDAVVIDDTLEVTGNDLSGATVSIEGGFDRDEDVLAAEDEHGITSTYDAETGVLTLEGEADASDYEDVLRSVTYDNTAVDPAETDREISFTLGTNTVYSETTGHYYRYVENEGISWTDARDAAESQDQFGLDGSLATITAEEENRFLLDRFESVGWIGATDEDEEGVWRWVTGPEGEEADGQGRHFFTQTSSHVGSHDMYDGATPGGGEAVDGSYSNWERNEPNNKWPRFGGQDYAFFCYGTGGCTDGAWMDLDGTHRGETTPEGYFVQFGGLADDPDVTLSESTSVSVVQDQPPVADAGNDIETDEDAEITLDASGSTDDFGLDSYDWDFGDGTTDSGVEVTHTYTTDGEYAVTLTVTDDADQTSDGLVNVTVIDNTVIIANPGTNKTVKEGSVFEMDGSGSEASDGIASYHWDFGDGTASGEQPTYVYDDPGEYDVTLTVTDSEGNDATSTTTVTVRDVTPPDADAGEDQTVDEGDPVTLDASGSTDNVEIASYEWDTTGDGRIDTTGETDTTSFDQPGEHDVTLFVTDTSGNVGTDTMTVTVVDTTAPVADAGENVSVGQGERVDFDGTNSTDNVAIADMSWNFGDGNEADGSEVTHRFADVTGDYEEYDVELTVTDTSGNEATDTLTVTVTAAPEIETSDQAADYVEATEPAVVGEGIEITYPSDDTLAGAEVIIGSGFEFGDRLEYDRTLANTLGISGHYVGETGVLSFDGDATASEYEQVLETVEYEFDGVDPSEANRTITFSIGTGALYFTDTGNYYEYIEDPGITWYDARDAAEDRTHHGLQGYLATVTAQEENDFILDRHQGAGWIGASDAAEEGTWRWVTGPEGQEDGEAGRHFFTQTGSDTGLPEAVYGGSTPGGGEAVGDNYVNWASNEPNDYRSGQDYAHFCFESKWCPDGKWNDFQSDHSGIDGYVVEYGGMAGDPDISLSDDRNVTVTRDRPPVADAGTDTDVGTSDQIELDASNSTDDFGIDSYQWEFGDGNTSAGESTIHSYGADGDYTVTLTVFDTASQSDTDTLSVTVIDDSILVANAGANYTIDEGETVTLDASGSEASAGIDAYEWDVGADGTTDATTVTTDETFTAPGEYPVTLTVTDKLDNTVTTTTHVLVRDTTPPLAAIDGDEERTVDNGTALTFNATSTEPTHSDIESYEWDFTGNDRTDATGENATFTFVRPGEYNVSLTVTDESGNVDVDYVDVTVADVTPPTVLVGEDRTVQAGHAVTFDGSESYDNVAIDTVTWDFGEGTTATDLVATHTYQPEDEGEQEVTLTLTDTSDNEATESLTVTIENTEPTISDVSLANPADFNIRISLVVDQPLETLSVSIDGPESETLTLASFTETEEAGTYTYEATYEGDTPGEYMATVDSAVDAIGNEGATGETASVRTLDADASASSYLGGVGSPIELRSSDSHIPDNLDPEFKWDINDNGAFEYTGETVTHEFADPSEIDVTLSLQTEAHTVNDTITVEIEDRDAPTVRLDADETVDNNSQITFDASDSTDNVGITNYRWDFGDGTTVSGETEDEPSHIYTEPGTYTVTVTASDAANNTETNSTSVTVLGPYASFSTTKLTYGDTPVNSENILSVRVTNDGTEPLEIQGTTAITGTDADQYDLTGAASDLPIVVSPGSSVSVAVEYAPDEVDDHDATLELETNHNNVNVDLGGAGVDSDLEALTPTVSFDDTALGDAVSAAVEFENTGGAESELDAVTIVGTDADQFAIEETPASIGPGQTDDITIAFAPTKPGEQTATLRVKNATGATTATVPLNGTGFGPSLNVKDDAVTFGEVGIDRSTATTLALRNLGNEVLDVQDAHFEGANADQFVVEAKPATVSADGEDEIQFAFTPDVLGTVESTLVIETNDSDSPVEITVNGTGVAAEIDADPRSIQFEDVEVGETVHTRIEVENKVRSKTDLGVNSTFITGADADEFGIENGGAPFELAPGQTRYINVSFTPSDTDDKQAQLQIHSDAGNEPQINVWLSSSDSYIVVQEVAVDDELVSSSTVNIDARNVDVGSTLAINVSQPGTRERPVGFDELGMSTLDEENFEIDAVHDDEPPSGPDAQAYEESGVDTLQYTRLNHSVDSDTNFTDTSVTFRVAKENVSTDSPDDVSLHRWNDTHDEWREMDLNLQGESSSYYVFESETSGFSQFAVTAVEESDPDPDDGGSSSPTAPDVDDEPEEETDDEPTEGETDDGPTEEETDDEPTEEETDGEPTDESIEGESTDDETADDEPAGETADDGDCGLFGYDFGSFIICWYWWVMMFILIILVAGTYHLLRKRPELSTEQ